MVWQGSAGNRRPYANQTPFCGPTRQTVFPSHGARVFNVQAIDVDNVEGVQSTQDVDPAGSQAREVELERSGE